jgi:hypothetical protein
MKSLSFALIFTLLVTSSLFAQHEMYLNLAPKAIIGHWKVLEPKDDVKFESIIFYPGGLLNIDTRGSKMVLNYKVSKRSQGYEVSISGMEHTAHFSSFFIKSVEGDKMQITDTKENSNKTVTLQKTKDISSGIIPLETR